MSSIVGAEVIDSNGAQLGGLAVPIGQLIVAKVAATNTNGTGVYSEENTLGVTAQGVPSAPTAAPSRGAQTTKSQVDVQWQFLTDSVASGGSPILSYQLELDDGQGGAFLPVVGSDPTNNPYTLNSKIVTTAIFSGRSYRVRYKAYNVHGWGGYSPEATIIAATVPGAPAEPSLTVNGVNVRITWADPTDTGGASITITAFRIEIRLPDGATFTEVSACNGTDASLVSAKTCDIPMSTFTTPTGSGGLGFAQGNEITARITAANVIGYGSAGSVASLATTVAQVAPLTPLAGPRRGTGTDASQIVIEWDPVVDPQNGGSAVTSYNLQWDAGSGNFDSQIDLTGISSDYTLSSFTQVAGVVTGTAY